MKKYLLILLVALVGVGFTSCKKKAAGTIEVTVTDAAGDPMKGADVCVFFQSTWESQVHYLQNADFKETTNADGLATIKISGFWLSENGTPFYCAVCDAQGAAVAYEQVIVKPGETVEVAF